MVAGITIAGELSSPRAASRSLLRAVSWLLGSSVMSQALRLFSSLVLTRLLAPEAFGLVATLQTVYLGLVLLSDLGVWQSVVNAPDGSDSRFLGTARAVQLARGVALALAIVGAAAGLKALQTAWPSGLNGVFRHPDLPLMLALFSLMALAQGLESMKLALAQRRLQTAAVARLEITSQAIGVVVTVALAWWGASAWSLVAGSVVSAALRSAFSHLWLAGPTAALCWDKKQAEGLLGFGKWIVLSSLIGFMAAHGEKLLLGAMLPPATVGVYAIAGTLLSALVGVVNMLNGHFVFPSLSRALRNSHEEAVVVYARVQRIADWTLGLLAGALTMCGRGVVELLYDRRYDEAGWILQGLAVGLIGLRFQVLEQMMFAMSRPADVTRANTWRALALFLLVPLGYFSAGLAGAVAGIVWAQFAAWPLAWRFRQTLGIRWAEAESSWPAAVVCGCALGWLGYTGLPWLLS